MVAAQGIRAGRAFVELFADDSKLVRGLKAAQRRLRAFGASVRAMGTKLLAVGSVVAGPLAFSVKAASDMEETMNKFNVVFGENAKAVKEWGDTFGAEVGRSKQQIADFLAGTQDLLVPIGFEPGAATEMSKQLTALAVDLASFNNKADADVLRDLHAALTGSSEVMKKYGVIVNETAVKQELLNQGLDPSNATEQQKVMARWAIIMRGTTAAQGDAIRSAGSFANQMKALRAKIADAAAEIGSALLPVITPLVTKITEAVKIAAAWIKENRALVVTLFKIGVAVAAGGFALILFGAAISGVASVLGAFATVASGIATAIGLIGTALGALLSPIGLVVAGFVGLATYIITATDAGADALNWLGERFQALKNTALAAFQGIGDALAAGDLTLAAKILWLTLKMEWQKGINWLQAKWLDFKGFFVSVFQNAVFNLARFLTDAWAGIQIAWVETTSFLADAWSIFIAALKKGWQHFAGFFKKVWARVKAVFTDSDADAEIQKINDEIAQQNQEIDRRRNEQILERDQHRRRRRNEIERDRIGAQTALDDIQRRDQADREARHQAALKTSEDKLAEARREWEAALREAAEKRKAAEASGEADGPDRLKKFQQQLKEIGNKGGALDQAEKKTVGVQGAFNAAAIRGLGAGGPADRTAKAVEAMDKKLAVLVREAQHGGLVFA